MNWPVFLGAFIGAAIPGLLFALIILMARQ